MTAHDFESALPAAILTKGRSYYNDGQVIFLEQTEPGQWQATVSGTEDYEVNVSMDESGDIEEAFCNCPHDADYCKHIVAALYAIRAEIGPAGSPSLPKKKVTDASDFATLLAKIPAEELREFLRDHARSDRAFRSLFLAHFADATGDSASKEKYAAIIRAAAKTAAGRGGFIEYDAMPKAIKPVEMLLSQAGAALGKKHYATIFAIAAAVIEEVEALLEKMDDSRGTAYDCVHNAFELLTGLAQTSDAPPDLQDALFAYALAEAAKKGYDSDGFVDDWLDLLLSISHTKPQTDAVLQLLDAKLAAVRGSGRHGRHDRNRLLKYQTDLRARIGQADEADRLRRQHLDLPEVRMEIVSELLKVEAYDRSKTLLREGIAQAEKDKLPIVARQFMEMLLSIAQRQNDVPETRSLAWELFKRTHEMLYYRLLKKCFTAAEWPHITENIIAQLKPHERRLNWERLPLPSVLAAVFIEEGFFDPLMALVEAAPSLENAERYHQHLLPRYPERVLGLYENALRKSAAEVADRAHYKVIADVLKRMQSWPGGADVVAALLKDFKERYLKRRAMIDELGKAG